MKISSDLLRRFERGFLERQSRDVPDLGQFKEMSASELRYAESEMLRRVNSHECELIVALGFIRSKKSMSKLVDIFNNSKGICRVQAARSLYLITENRSYADAVGVMALPSFWRDIMNKNVRLEAIMALQDVGIYAVRYLIKSMKSRSKIFRYHSSRIFCDIMKLDDLWQKYEGSLSKSESIRMSIQNELIQIAETCAADNLT